MEHSKAPWNYDFVGTITSADEKVVADIKWDLKMSVAEGQANLKLIAAAPELLEACILILRHAEILINSNHPDWIAAHDAIAKATGVNPDPINPYISNRGF